MKIARVIQIIDQLKARERKFHGLAEIEFSRWANLGDRGIEHLKLFRKYERKWRLAGVRAFKLNKVLETLK